MTHIHKDHTLEFPIPVELQKKSLVKRIFKAIRSGFIYSGDK